MSSRGCVHEIERGERVCVCVCKRVCVRERDSVRKGLDACWTLSKIDGMMDEL